MNLVDRLKTSAKARLNSGLRRTAIAAAATAIAGWIDSQGITSEGLEQSILRQDPILEAALAKVPADAWQGTRMAFAQVAQQMGEQDWLEILKQPVLSANHPGHVQVILRHHAWYRSEMDAVRRLFTGE